MIEYLKGVIRKKLPTGIILDCQGVGYGVNLTLSTLCDVPLVGESFELWIYTKVREDALTLYGFLTYEERLTFEILLQVNGVGPKVAIAILSTLNLRQLRDAAESKDLRLLEQVPGIGRRSAEKIALELGNKIEKLPASYASPNKGKEVSKNLHNQTLKEDLLSAMTNLGFKDKQILPLVDKILDTESNLTFSELVKKTLLLLNQEGKNPPPLGKSKIEKFDKSSLF